MEQPKKNHIDIIREQIEDLRRAETHLRCDKDEDLKAYVEVVRHRCFLAAKLPDEEKVEVFREGRDKLLRFSKLLCHCPTGFYAGLLIRASETISFCSDQIEAAEKSIMDNENTKDRAQLHVYPDADTAKQESQQRIEPMKKEATEPSPDWDPRMFDPEVRDVGFLPPMETTGFKTGPQLTIHHPWFLGLVEVMKTIGENFHQEKKLRIVIDYDPQDHATVFTFLREKETPRQGEDQ